MLKQQTNNTKDKTFYAGIHPKYNKEITRFNLDILKARVINGKASLIVIDGSGLGEGKTTFAVHIADYIQGAPIDLNVQLALLIEEILLKSPASSYIITCFFCSSHKLSFAWKSFPPIAS